MADNWNFDRLVSGLSMDERLNLVEKMKGQSEISAEPLYVENDETVSAADIETEYSKLPWYYRLWYFILGFIKSKTSIMIFEDHKVMALGNQIIEKSPGLYDYQRGWLLPAFYRQITGLKEAARFFYSALDISVNRDRGAFFAFLGSLEITDIQKKIEAETDPAALSEKHPDTPDLELRQMALRAMDEALNLISDESRNNMYSDARSLNCLKELSSFLFDRLIMSFGNNSVVGGETCSAGVIRELLVSLNNILHSLRVVPPMILLESLFIFVLQEKSDESGFDLNREMRTLLTKAEGSLMVIRDFNKRVPLTWIIRCSTRNMSYSPRDISGGEDWFLTYRDYWKRRTESLFADFIKERRHRDLLGSFQVFFKDKELKILANTKSDSNPDGLPIKGSFALSFLLTFYSVVFVPEIIRFLKPILIDGEFQRKENRAEFTESYNDLIKLEDVINKFDRNCSPSGNYGERYAQVRQDMISLPVKRRKIQIVTDEAREEAEGILEGAREAAISMMNILNGILGRDTKGRYGALTNLTKIAGKDGQFIAGLDETSQMFQRVVKLLDDIEAMENVR